MLNGLVVIRACALVSGRCSSMMSRARSRFRFRAIAQTRSALMRNGILTRTGVKFLKIMNAGCIATIGAMSIGIISKG